MKIVVTGGSSGVGDALVERLARNNHEIWVLDVNPPADGQSHYIATDMASEQSIQAAVAELPAQIDGLANVAGIARADAPEQVLAVNFLGLRLLTETLLPRLAPTRGVVNVSSVAGRDWQRRYERLLPLLDTASFAEGLAWCETQRELLARDPYTLSKQCVTAYTLRAAQAALGRGVRVNCVSPGPIATPLYPQFEALMGRQQSEWMQAQTGRAASPDEIAQVVDLLLTGECVWLNGVDVPVDGGYTAGVESGWIDFAASPLMQQRSAGKR